MGGFEPFIDTEESARPGPAVRSVLSGSVGPEAENAPRDLRLIRRTLQNVGLLSAKSQLEADDAAVFAAIRDAARSLGVLDGDAGPNGAIVRPGGSLELGFRKALAGGRFPLSHRAVQNTAAKPGARILIGGGMRRALQKLAQPSPSIGSETPAAFRRAALPNVAPATMQANRRLAETLADGTPHPALVSLIAETIQSGGRQGFADVRDLWQALQVRAPDVADSLGGKLETMLDGRARRRIRKLRLGQPPTEADFN